MVAAQRIDRLEVYLTLVVVVVVVVAAAATTTPTFCHAGHLSPTGQQFTTWFNIKWHIYISAVVLLSGPSLAF